MDDIPSIQEMLQTAKEMLGWMQYAVVYILSNLLGFGIIMLPTYYTWTWRGNEATPNFVAGSTVVGGTLILGLHAILTGWNMDIKGRRFPEVLVHVLIQIAVMTTVLFVVFWLTEPMVEAVWRGFTSESAEESGKGKQEQGQNISERGY